MIYGHFESILVSKLMQSKIQMSVLEKNVKIMLVLVMS